MVKIRPGEVWTKNYIDHAAMNVENMAQMDLQTSVQMENCTVNSSRVLVKETTPLYSDIVRSNLNLKSGRVMRTYTKPPNTEETGPECSRRRDTTVSKGITLHEITGQPKRRRVDARRLRGLP
jgi:hypothetical protein